MDLFYYALHKPYGYLSQFTNEGRWKGLSELINVPSDVYAVGRLDAESEGLLLLTNDTTINKRLLHPKHKHVRTYWVQVEGDISSDAIQKMEQPHVIRINKKDHLTQPSVVRKLSKAPEISDRVPPIRERKSIPTSWLSISLTEGKNRQVRKMTAAAGFPTLRLIRWSIEELTLDGIALGELEQLDAIAFKTALHL